MQVLFSQHHDVLTSSSGTFFLVGPVGFYYKLPAISIVEVMVDVEPHGQMNLCYARLIF